MPRKLTGKSSIFSTSYCFKILARSCLKAGSSGLCPLPNLRISSCIMRSVSIFPARGSTRSAILTAIAGSTKIKTNQSAVSDARIVDRFCNIEETNNVIKPHIERYKRYAPTRDIVESTCSPFVSANTELNNSGTSSNTIKHNKANALPAIRERPLIP